MMLALVVALACCLTTLVTTRLALAYLRRRQILDRPNERSSHTMPTPRGLGLGLIPVVIAGWAALAASTSLRAEVWSVCVGATVLAVVAWVDDVRGLPAGPRLLIQAAAVGFGLWSVGAFPTWLPGPVAAIIGGVLWVGLINQVNFTDGIDGHLGAMGVSLGIGLFAVGLLAPAVEPIGGLALVVAGACAGFLPLNWHKAKAFMGDVGSVPLGFLIGWLLLRTLTTEAWPVAISLLLFYYVDTAITYGGRLARRERFWEPHKLYLYQRCAAAGMAHSHIVATVAVCNLCLIGIAIASTMNRWLALTAMVPVALSYTYLSRRAKPINAR